nr:MAG TPA: hypothetical protein [Caudoviricetes sp.]DAS27800.1 MAG TPA: hypothetical protein [Caudoviricetes sp.]
MIYDTITLQLSTKCDSKKRERVVIQKRRKRASQRCISSNLR